MAGLVLDVDRGFFGFDEEFPRAADAKAVVGRLVAAADFDGVLVDDVLVGLGVAPGVVHVPAEGFEEWIDEFLTEASFVVASGAVVFFVELEALD